jgi:hypothetical protein
MDAIYYNQIATINSVRDDDEAEEIAQNAVCRFSHTIKHYKLTVANRHALYGSV